MIRRAVMPDWWDWELRLTDHLLRRMVDRKFNETEVRTMLAFAEGPEQDAEPGRWIVRSKWQGRQWKIVVEPDPVHEVLAVLTAYPIE